MSFFSLSKLIANSLLTIINKVENPQHNSFDNCFDTESNTQDTHFQTKVESSRTGIEMIRNQLGTF